MYDIITIGGATLDVFMKDDEFEVSKTINEKEKLCLDFGSKILCDEVHFTNGGGGMNTAASFSKLGFRTAFLGAIGDDEIGDEIEKKLKEQDVSLNYLLRIPEEKSGLSVALHAGERERTLLLYRGANDHLTPDLIPWTGLEDATWIYLSHLSGESGSLLPKIAEFVYDHDIDLAWNPGSSQIEKGIEYLSDLLKETTILNINKEEAEELTGISISRNKDLAVDEMDDLTPLFKELFLYGPKIIVITDGRRGAAVSSKGKILISRNHEIGKTIDTTGAGDAFGSGFVAGYIYKGKIETALKWGIVQSGAVITKFGAQNGLLSRNEIQKELRNLKAEKIFYE